MAETVLYFLADKMQTDRGAFSVPHLATSSSKPHLLTFLGFAKIAAPARDQVFET